jgi:hypothetical protein
MISWQDYLIVAKDWYEWIRPSGEKRAIYTPWDELHTAFKIKGERIKPPELCITGKWSEVHSVLTQCHFIAVPVSGKHGFSAFNLLPFF